MRFNPARVLVVSFLIVIGVGTFLLKLPISTTSNISFIDALYTATSAVCVTGLIVKNTAEDFTLFGKLVILLLIQIGGLSYMTLSTIIILFFRKKTSARERILVREQMGILNFKNFRGFIFDVLKVVLIFEGIGAFLLFFYFLHLKFPLKSALLHSVFHSVSAFCNAGFSTFSNNLADFSRDLFVPLVITLLFISGGLGFLVWSDLYRTKIKRENSFLSLHSRIVLFLTFSLIIIATILIFLLEYNKGLKDYPLLNKLVISFFHATTPRTAGFNLISVGSFLPATLILLIFLMFIGASPGGTGGGIKTTTFFVSLLYPFFYLRGIFSLRTFKRRIAPEVKEKGIAIFLLSLGLIMVALFTISLFEKDIELKRVLFEIFSAFGTVGLSLGAKSNSLLSASYDFSTLSKLIIIFVIFLGRVGMLNFLKVFFKEKKVRYEYPEDEISIG